MGRLRESKWQSPVEQLRRGNYHVVAHDSFALSDGALLTRLDLQRSVIVAILGDRKGMLLNFTHSTPDRMETIVEHAYEHYVSQKERVRSCLMLGFDYERMQDVKDAVDSYTSHPREELLGDVDLFDVAFQPIRKEIILCRPSLYQTVKYAL